MSKLKELQVEYLNTRKVYQETEKLYKETLKEARKTVKIEVKKNAKIYTREDGYAIYVPNSSNSYGERKVWKFVNGKKGELIIKRTRMSGWEFKDWLLLEA